MKSTALQHPEAVRLERWGPVGDRLFFLVDDRDRLFGGDADTPLMLLHAAFDAGRDRLELCLPGGRVLEGPAVAGRDALRVAYDGRRVKGHVVAGEWSRILSDHAGRSLRLARLDEPGTLVDEPVTIVSLASIMELGRRGGRESLDSARFRMTFEVDGCGPHEEDAWAGRRIRIGEAELEVGEAIPRCVITTLDPKTGRQDFPTLKVIAGYRELLPNRDVPFGRYARVSRPGTVCVGDRVETMVPLSHDR